ncbi:MAG: tetratricopeptide repeat protein, partial [SAR324 cluster bacterium]|nr:tetratricopeptide repeat protein [SAR324 cluster bacterium]
MTRPVHALVLVIAAALAACGGSLPSEALIEKESRQGLATLEASLRERVRDDPDDYAALRLLALTQLRLEKPGEAELNALRATRAGPFVAANAVTLGRVYEAQQKRLRALTVYGHAIELDPGRISAYVRYALVQERLGNPAKALETLAQALLREPRHFAARFHQARLLLARGDLDAAARAAEQARRVRPRERESLLLLVAVYRAQGRLAGARLLAEQALELHPGDRALLAALLAVHRERARWSEARSVLQRLREAGRLSPEERLLEAEVLRGEGRPRDARAALERLIRDAPRFPPARIRMARLLIAEGRHREAIGSCEEAVALAPRAAQAYYWKAVAHFHLDQSELGEAALSLAERLRPGNRALRLLRIARLLAEQRVDAAGSRLEAYREEYPRDPALSLLAAEYHALSGDATRADAELAPLAPNFAPDAVRFARVRNAYLAAQWRQVIELTAPLLNHANFAWRAAYLRGAALWRLGSSREAIAQLTPYLARRQGKALFHHLVGYLYLLENQRETAEKTFLEGLALFPDDPLLIEGLSRIYMEAQNWGRARRVLERGLARESGQRALFLDRLVQVSRRRDGTDGGRQALQRYLESGDPARAMGRAAPATA